MEVFGKDLEKRVQEDTVEFVPHARDDVASFTTSRGSEYMRQPDGRVQRNKVITGETFEATDVVVFFTTSR